MGVVESQKMAKAIEQLKQCMNETQALYEQLTFLRQVLDNGKDEMSLSLDDEAVCGLRHYLKSLEKTTTKVYSAAFEAHNGINREVRHE